MRFEKLRADSFGCLKDWESPDIDSDIVIVCGRNESGKSTLLKVAETLLYGWSPATANGNPYVPWDESEASCDGFLIVGDQSLHIGRRLRARPAGFLKIGDDQVDIANKSLPMIDHISREIYREVYALTSDELNMPSEALWEKLKDQLLAGQYYSFIKSSHKVVDELDGEANSLWRPDRRGKPESKLLKEELSKLRRELIDAEGNDKKLYELEDRLVESQGELDRLTQEKVELIAYIDWCENILPIQSKEEEIRKLLESSGDIAAFDHIPSDLEKEFSDIEADIKKLREGIEERLLELEQLNNTANSLTDVHTRLLNNEEDIEELIRSYERIAGNLDKILELDRERDRIETLLKRDGDELIIGGWKDVYIDSLRAIDEASLRQKVSLYSDTKTKVDEKRIELSALNTENYGTLNVSKLVPGGVVVGIIGVLGLFLSNSLLKFGGMLSLAIGVTSLLLGWSVRDGERERRKSAHSKGVELKALDDELKNMQGEIHGSLHGIPLASIDEAYMGDSIIIDVDRLKRHLEDLSGLDREYNYIKSEINAKTDMVDGLMEDCMLDLGRDILVDIDRLNSGLNAAKDRKYRAEEAKEKIKNLEAEIDQLKYELEKLEGLKEDILLKLENFDGNDLAEKMKDLSRRRQLYSKAKLLQEQLDIEKKSLPDSCFKDLHRWYIENRDGKRVLDLDELAYAKVRMDELDSKLNSLNLEIGALEKELEYGRYIKTAHELKGEMEAIEEELREAAKNRDRLTLLKNIINRADSQLREEHQPDVLNRASEYLAIITGGKYSRIFISGEDDSKVAILQRDNPYPIEVGETISRGTQEQIYLALRLAMMDHLDGEYPMPTFLDELFINWDGMRIQNGLELVKKISAKRQIFIFTCHNWFVNLLSDNLNTQVVVMDEIDHIW